MTTNTNVTLEFFAASNDSDDDASLEVTGTDADVMRALRDHLGVLEVHLAFIERDGDADRYNVVSVASPTHSRGVAYITRNA